MECVFDSKKAAVYLKLSPMQADLIIIQLQAMISTFNENQPTEHNLSGYCIPDNLLINGIAYEYKFLMLVCMKSMLVSFLDVFYKYTQKKAKNPNFVLHSQTKNKQVRNKYGEIVTELVTIKSPNLLSIKITEAEAASYYFFCGQAETIFEPATNAVIQELYHLINQKLPMICKQLVADYPMNADSVANEAATLLIS
jgi:hypothetical protein